MHNHGLYFSTVGASAFTVDLSHHSNYPTHDRHTLSTGDQVDRIRVRRQGIVGRLVYFQVPSG